MLKCMVEEGVKVMQKTDNEKSDRITERILQRLQVGIKWSLLSNLEKCMKNLKY